MPQDKKPLDEFPLNEELTQFMAAQRYDGHGYVPGVYGTDVRYFNQRQKHAIRDLLEKERYGDQSALTHIRKMMHRGVDGLLNHPSNDYVETIKLVLLARARVLSPNVTYFDDLSVYHRAADDLVRGSRNIDDIFDLVVVLLGYADEEHLGLILENAHLIREFDFDEQMIIRTWLGGVARPWASEELVIRRQEVLKILNGVKPTFTEALNRQDKLALAIKNRILRFDLAIDFPDYVGDEFDQLVYLLMEQSATAMKQASETSIPFNICCELLIGIIAFDADRKISIWRGGA